MTTYPKLTNEELIAMMKQAMKDGLVITAEHIYKELKQREEQASHENNRKV
jgi:hypothetical protein